MDRAWLLLCCRQCILILFSKGAFQGIMQLYILLCMDEVTKALQAQH